VRHTGIRNYIITHNSRPVSTPMRTVLVFLLFVIITTYPKAIYSTRDVLLVSAYFPLDNNLNVPIIEYMYKVPPFLNAISQPVVFFTPAHVWSELNFLYLGKSIVVNDHTDESLKYIRKVFEAPTTPDRFIVVITTFSTIWDVPFASNYSQYFHEVTSKVIDYSFFGKIHPPDLSAVWLCKVYLLEYVVRHYKFLWPYIEASFWVDAGVLRVEHGRADTLSNWPLLHLMKNDFGDQFDRFGDRCILVISSYPEHYPKPQKSLSGKHGELFLMGSDNFDDVEAFLYAQFFVAGLFFGGSDQAIEVLSEAFYSKFERLVSEGRYVGREELVLTALALENPHHFAAVDLRVNEDWDGLYDIVDRFADPEERRANYTFNANGIVQELELFFAAGMYEALANESWLQSISSEVNVDSLTRWELVELMTIPEDGSDIVQLYDEEEKMKRLKEINYFDHMNK
jgi:hypothetical protein